MSPSLSCSPLAAAVGNVGSQSYRKDTYAKGGHFGGLCSEITPLPLPHSLKNEKLQMSAWTTERERRKMRKP